MAVGRIKKSVHDPLLRIRSDGLVGRGRRSWGRARSPCCPWGELRAIDHRRIVIDVAAIGTGVRTAAVAASAARVVAAVVAGIPAVGRIAVEVAPITFAAIRAAPAIRGEQGEQATQRPAIPRTSVAAVAARIGTGIGARIAAGRATATAHVAARLGASTAASIVAVGNHRSPRGAGCAIRRPAGRTATITALIATATVAVARTIAEDRLTQAAAAAGRQHSRKQTEK